MIWMVSLFYLIPDQEVRNVAKRYTGHVTIPDAIVHVTKKR
jgi:hypothetical protein